MALVERGCVTLPVSFYSCAKKMLIVLICQGHSENFGGWNAESVELSSLLLGHEHLQNVNCFLSTPSSSAPLPSWREEKNHIVLLTSPYPFKMLDLVLGTPLTNLGFGVFSQRSKGHFKKAGTLNP